MNAHSALLTSLIFSTILFTMPLFALAEDSWQWTQYNAPSGITNFGSTFVANDGLHTPPVVHANISSPNRTVYVSTTGGVSWTAHVLSGEYGAPEFLAGSTDGKYLYATFWNGKIHYSSDYGTTWSTAPVPNRSWLLIDASYDGRYVVAVQRNDNFNPGYVWASSDYGVTWTAHTALGSRNWFSGSVSATGATMAASARSGEIYVSTDYGRTWVARTSTGEDSLTAFALSGDGTLLMAAGCKYLPDAVTKNCDTSSFGNTYHAFISRDLGLTWEATPSPNDAYTAVLQLNNDGSMAVMGIAGVANGAISSAYSTDYGASWQDLTPSGSFNTWPYSTNVSMSKNGLFAVEGVATKFFTAAYGESTVVSPRFIIGSYVKMARSDQVYSKAQISGGSKVVCSQFAETIGTLAAGPQTDSSGTTWWKVNFPDCTGWVRESSLALTSTSLIQASLSANPPVIDLGKTSMLTWSSTGASSCMGTGFDTRGLTLGSVYVSPVIPTEYTVTCSDTSGTSASASAYVAVTSLTPLLNIGSRVYTTESLNVRSKTNISASTLTCTQPIGSRGTIMDGPKSGQRYTWWYVDFDTVCDGWVVSDYLALVATAGANSPAPTGAIGANTDTSLSQYASVLLSLQSILSQLEGLAKGR